MTCIKVFLTLSTLLVRWYLRVLVYITGFTFLLGSRYLIYPNSCVEFFIKYFFTPEDRLDLFQRIQILYYILSIEGSSTRSNHIGRVPSKCLWYHMSWHTMRCHLGTNILVKFQLVCSMAHSQVGTGFSFSYWSLIYSPALLATQSQIHPLRPAKQSFLK